RFSGWRREPGGVPRVSRSHNAFLVFYIPHWSRSTDSGADRRLGNGFAINGKGQGKAWPRGDGYSEGGDMAVLARLRQRHLQPEWMDQPGLDEGRHRQALR